MRAIDHIYCSATNGFVMNLRTVDLNLLVTLDALLIERNVTRAAQRLSLTQSAVSSQLARLRDLFGDPLLIPQARGVIPTQRALDLMVPLKQALADLENLVKPGAAFDPKTTTATIRIATTGAIHFTLCVPLIRTVREQAPTLRLALHQLDIRQAARQLEEGDIDLVIIGSALLNPLWKSRQVMKEELVTVLSKRHPAATQPMDLDLFCRLEHLLVSPQSGGFRGSVDEILAGLGRSRRVAMSVQNFMVVPFILEATDLVSTLPSYLSRSFPDTLVVIKPPFDLPSFAIHTAWHPRSHNDPAHQWVRQRIEEVGVRLTR
jgi:DNA-binding transcriptional LysR family regulator